MKRTSVKWKGSWYQRVGKGSRLKNTWRNRYTGEVRTKTPTGKQQGYEFTGSNVFGASPIRRSPPSRARSDWSKLLHMPKDRPKIIRRKK